MILNKIRELNQLSSSMHKVTLEILEFFNRRQFNDVKSLVEELLGKESKQIPYKNKIMLKNELVKIFGDQIVSLNLNEMKIKTNQLLLLYSEKFPNDYSSTIFGRKMMASLSYIQTKCNCFFKVGGKNIRYWTIYSFNENKN
jgi:hypothetical protein